jgi:hypothetical protein
MHQIKKITNQIRIPNLQITQYYNHDAISPNALSVALSIKNTFQDVNNEQSSSCFLIINDKKKNSHKLKIENYAPFGITTKEYTDDCGIDFVITDLFLTLPIPCTLELRNRLRDFLIFLNDDKTINAINNFCFSSWVVPCEGSLLYILGRHDTYSKATIF